MWIKQTGQIKENIYMIGSPSNPMYLIDCGKEWVLIEGGIEANTQIVLEQLNQYLPDLNLLKHWFITHSHYDHSGAIETLYPYLNEINIYASEEAVNNLHNQKYVEKVRELNKLITKDNTLESSELKKRANLLQIPFITVQDNDTINIGKNTWEIISTPGHSLCSISIYNPENKELYVSDALGEIISEKEWFPLAFQSTSKFATSIDKLNDIEVDFIALGHHGALTSTDAEFASFYSLQSYSKIIDQIVELLKKEGIESTIDQIRNKFYKASEDFVPKFLYDKSIAGFIEQLKKEKFIPQSL